MVATVVMKVKHPCAVTVRNPLQKPAEKLRVLIAVFLFFLVLDSLFGLFDRNF